MKEKFECTKFLLTNIKSLYLLQTLTTSCVIVQDIEDSQDINNDLIFLNYIVDPNEQTINKIMFWNAKEIIEQRMLYHLSYITG